MTKEMQYIEVDLQKITKNQQKTNPSISSISLISFLPCMRARTQLF